MTDEPSVDDQPDDVEVESLDAMTDVEYQRDRDGVSSLRDVEAEQGDEEGVSDEFDIDVKEARALGAAPDDLDEQEPRLD